MTKKKMILILSSILLILIAIYILISPKGKKVEMGQDVPYSYSNWFSEPEINKDESKQTDENVIVFRYD